MLIICSECNAKVSDKAKECQKCGAPVPGWLDKLPDSVQVTLGFFIIGIFIYGLVSFFFLDNKIEIARFLCTGSSSPHNIP